MSFGTGPVALAYSGGLSSTLVAMVRLANVASSVCVVAGVDESEAVPRRQAAKAHLDYGVHFVRLDLAETLRIRDRTKDADRRLSPTVVRGLVPLRAVVEETNDSLILTGFGSRPTDTSIGTVLESVGVQSSSHGLVSESSAPAVAPSRGSISLGLRSNGPA